MKTAGQRIAEAIREKGLSQAEAARLLEISESYLTALISGKLAVSAHVAVRLEKHLGMDAQLMILRQATFELGRARFELERVSGE
jgi:plasmid maintenance system antidote protein VapI